MALYEEARVAALEYSDINENNITINKALVLDYNGNYVLKKPKTNSSYRNIELPHFIIEKIGTGKGRILSITPEIITNRFKRLANKAELGNIRFHDLRHYQASILHALGIPDKYIMERGGWSSSATLNNIYKHTLKDKEKAFNDIAIAYFEKMQHEMQHSKQ